MTEAYEKSEEDQSNDKLKILLLLDQPFKNPFNIASYLCCLVRAARIVDYDFGHEEVLR